MRTTVTLADDVAAAVEHARASRAIGVSEAINQLVRAGLTRSPDRAPFTQTTHDLGPGIDVTDVADALETLDGPAAP